MGWPEELYILICDGRHLILQTASDLIAIERPLSPKSGHSSFPRKRRKDAAEIAENKRFLPLWKYLIAPRYVSSKRDTSK